jgi:hypothetical protein
MHSHRLDGDLKEADGRMAVPCFFVEVEAID